MKRYALLLGVALFVFIVAIGFAGTALAEGKYGGTLVHVMEGSPRHFNPAVQSGTNTAMPGTQLFASPLRFDENWKPHPYLAESWKISDDGKSVTLKLVDGATFHDGKPITSEDVAFSIMTIKENHPFKSMFAPVERVETPDARTAVIRMSNPHPAILLALSGCLCPIIPKHIYGDGQDPKTHPMNLKPIGSGPFKFVDYKAGEYIVLEKNENFFIKGRPYLDKIIYKIFNDMNSMVMSVETQESHIYPLIVSLRDINRLKKKPYLEVIQKGYAAVGPLNWLAFNLKREPVSNKLVRKAIAFAIDGEFINKALHLGLPQRATGPIVPDSPLYSGDVERYDLDIEKANKLLDEAGYPKGADGIRFSLTADHGPWGPEQMKMVAEYLKSQLKKVGIDINVRTSPDFPSWANRISNYEFDMTMDSVYNWGDPVIGVHRTYLSNNIRKGVIWSNTQSYSNPKVDQLLAQAGTEANFEKRKALYAEFQKIVVDDAPIIYVNVDPFHTIYNTGLRNIPINIWGTMSPLDEVYWEKEPK